MFSGVWVIFVVSYLKEIEVCCDTQQDGHSSIVVDHCPKLGLKFTSSVPISLQHEDEISNRIETSLASWL